MSAAIVSIALGVAALVLNSVHPSAAVTVFVAVVIGVGTFVPAALYLKPLGFEPVVATFRGRLRGRLGRSDD